MKNIMDTAQGHAQLHTFAKVLVAAELGDFLNGPGPFTVFAPADAAFATMPPGSLSALLRDIPYLQRILNNHVIAGKFDSNHFPRLKGTRTLAGAGLHIELKPKVTINQARILKPNIACSNGIIHVIDHVLMLSMVKAEVGAGDYM